MHCSALLVLQKKILPTWSSLIRFLVAVVLVKAGTYIHLLTYLSISTYLPTYLSISTYLYLPIHIFTCLSVCPSFYLSFCLSVCPSVCLSIYIDVSIYVPISTLSILLTIIVSLSPGIALQSPNLHISCSNSPNGGCCVCSWCWQISCSNCKCYNCPLFHLIPVDCVRIYFLFFYISLKKVKKSIKEENITEYRK